jgi:hypothetical protein
MGRNEIHAPDIDHKRGAGFMMSEALTIYPIMLYVYLREISRKGDRPVAPTQEVKSLRNSGRNTILL